MTTGTVLVEREQATACSRFSACAGRLLTATCASFLTLSCLLPAAAAPDADKLLRAMEHAEHSLPYSAIETVQRPGAPTMKMRLWRSGGRRRFNYLEPPVSRGDVLLEDGVHVWLYHKADNSAVETRNGGPGGAGRLNFDQINRRFVPSLVGSANWAGRPAWVVLLKPRGAGRMSRKFWIDKQTRLRLRSEIYDSHGGRLRSTALSDLSFAPPAPAAFRWSPPAGAKVTRSGTLYNRLEQARLTTAWLHYPSRLPRGYAFESAVVDPAKHEAWLRYTNGVNRLSLFEQVSGRSGNTAARQVGHGGAWYWQSNGNRYLLVGSPDSDVNRVVAGMR